MHIHAKPHPFTELIKDTQFRASIRAFIAVMNTHLGQVFWHCFQKRDSGSKSRQKRAKHLYAIIKSLPEEKEKQKHLKQQLNTQRIDCLSAEFGDFLKQKLTPAMQHVLMITLQDHYAVYYPKNKNADNRLALNAETPDRIKNKAFQQFCADLDHMRTLRHALEHFDETKMTSQKMQKVLEQLEKCCKTLGQFLLPSFSNELADAMHSACKRTKVDHQVVNDLVVKLKQQGKERRANTHALFAFYRTKKQNRGQRSKRQRLVSDTLPWRIVHRVMNRATTHDEYREFGFQMRYYFIGPDNIASLFYAMCHKRIEQYQDKAIKHCPLSLRYDIEPVYNVACAIPRLFNQYRFEIIDKNWQTCLENAQTQANQKGGELSNTKRKKLFKQLEKEIEPQGLAGYVRNHLAHGGMIWNVMYTSDKTFMINKRPKRRKIPMRWVFAAMLNHMHRHNRAGDFYNDLHNLFRQHNYILARKDKQSPLHVRQWSNNKYAEYTKNQRRYSRALVGQWHRDLELAFARYKSHKQPRRALRPTKKQRQSLDKSKQSA